MERSDSLNIISQKIHELYGPMHINSHKQCLASNNTAQPVHLRSPISVISGRTQNTRYASIQKVHSKDLDQTARMGRLSRVFFGRTSP